MGGDQVVRVEPHDWDSCPTDGNPESPLLLPLHQDTMRNTCLWTMEQALTRHLIYQCFDLGLPSLQKCQKYMSIVFQPVSLFLLQQPKETESVLTPSTSALASERGPRVE